MNHVLSIAKKELRAYFLSPIALIFLFTFVAATLFAFSWVEGFFARNIADVRPLFLWLPRLLIFLGAALTMRLWSEEQKLGTMELLLTLPVEKWKLVVGKFLAALVLVAIALALTFHVPIMVSTMGDLDWGPVVGGYAAALLVAAAYLAIGLCISAITENQIIALIFTTVSCGFLYLLGSEAVAAGAGNKAAELLSALGTGSRFEAIRRGVIDLRDVLYYLSITGLFLVLNVVILHAKSWSQGSNTRARRTNAVMFAGLVGANLLALNLWMSGVTAARVDLTQRKEYTVSEVTKNLVRSLPEPLLIRGYFSDKTHPYLAPVVPRIRDMITELGVVSKGKVRTEFVDPRNDETLEKEANQAYGIRSFPFGVKDRHDTGVVNSYFSILVKYGDQYEVLSFDQLIEVQAGAQGGAEVKLRNLEYDLTRAIKKVAYGFQTLDALFADLKGEASLTAYITPNTLPDNFKEVPGRIEKIAKELVKESGGKLKFEVVNPDSAAKDMRQELYQKYGFKPFAASLFSQDTFYLHMLLKVGDKVEGIMPAESMAEADIKKELVAALRRSAPGFLKTIGLFKSLDEAPRHPQMPGQPPPQPQDVTRMFTKQLEETYSVKDVDLKDGRVPGDVDVLVVYAPKNLDDKQRFAIDQYLMRGGAVVVLAGKYELDLQASTEGIVVKKNNMGIEDLLASYGVTVGDSIVLDPQNEPFPRPVTRDLGGVRIRDVVLAPYPAFVDVRRDGLDRENPVVNGLSAITMQWAAPLTVTQAKDPKGGEKPAREVTNLIRSTDHAWTQADANAPQDFARYPQTGYAPGADQKSQLLAVAMKGKFDSYYKDKPSPIYGAEDNGGQGDRTGRTLKESPENARLVVVGSSSFVSDIALSISRQTGTDRWTSNIQLLQNLVDWSVEDVNLLSIRSRGTFARVLKPLKEDEKNRYDAGFYAVPAVLLFFGILVTTGRRRRMQPIDLDASTNPHKAAPSIGGSASEVGS